MAAPARGKVRVLADTGFFKALADPHDGLHPGATRFLSVFQGDLVTTEAVVVETCFFLDARQKQRWLSAVADGFVSLAEPDPEAHRRIAKLSEKYADLDPDYADLTLVRLAEVTGLKRILTVDERDFSALRIHGRQRFELVPWAP